MEVDVNCKDWVCGFFYLLSVFILHAQGSGLNPSITMTTLLRRKREGTWGTMFGKKRQWQLAGYALEADNPFYGNRGTERS